jgi:hypothetical protein
VHDTQPGLERRIQACYTDDFDEEAGLTGRTTSALREAVRVTRPGGLLFVAAIPRIVAFASAFLGEPVVRPLPTRWSPCSKKADSPSPTSGSPAATSIPPRNSTTR